MNGTPARASIATRLALMLALVALAVFSAVGALLHWSLERELLHAEGVELEGKADVVRHYIDEVQDSLDLGVLRHRLDDALIGNGALRVWIVAADGRVLYGGASAPAARPAKGGRLSITREDGVILTGLRHVLRTGAVLPEAQVLIGLDTRARQALMRTYDQATILVCALGLMLTISLGAWVTRFGLRPLRRLSDEAAGIAPGALSRRLSAHHGSRELEPFVESFNRALDRVEEAYRRLESFNADVAHELRTPLTTMISGTEVALSRPRTIDQLQEILESNLEVLRDLASMVNDMLFLANADHADVPAQVRPVDLSREARRVADFFDAILDDRGQRIAIHGSATVAGNAALLRRALVNLVDNASRHAPSGATITVSLRENDGTASVTVGNPGTTIAPEALPRLFDRFFRADPARSRSTEHHGLGLAIVRAIARMHGGEASARSSEGITEVGFDIVSSAIAEAP